MKDLDTIFGSAVNTAVRLGDFLIPATALLAYLHKHVDPAIFISHLEAPFQYTKSGSLTKLRYRGRFIALLSEHQVFPEGYNPDDLVIYNKSAETFCTSNSCFFHVHNEQTVGDLDVLIFDFTDAVRAGGLPITFWFDLEMNKELAEEQSHTRLFCIGYPSAVNNIDFETPCYDAQAVAVFGKPDQSSIKGRVSFVPTEEPVYEPSGMSGGGVFGVSVLYLEPRLYFAGILTNATKSKFNFLSASRIREVLDKAFPTHD